MVRSRLSVLGPSEMGVICRKSSASYPFAIRAFRVADRRCAHRSGRSAACFFRQVFGWLAMATFAAPPVMAQAPAPARTDVPSPWEAPEPWRTDRFYFQTSVATVHFNQMCIRDRYKGDRSRKENLVNYGFRLPSALDNRPLKFEEYEALLRQTIFLSATPAAYEEAHQGQVVEQVVRPTGLVDPVLIVRPASTQIDDLLSEIRLRVALAERVLVTTLTKRMAEELTDYLGEHEVRVRYLHSDIDTVERVEIIRDLRLGKFDVLVGINLLREGLDIPEVSLVAILDADKEGFLRSERSLIPVSYTHLDVYKRQAIQRPLCRKTAFRHFRG